MGVDARICSRCVLPHSPPNIVLDDSGVCNICREHEKKSGAKQTPLLETDFINILNRHKGRGSYDCLVMCSGGKDSTAALYYMKKRYRRQVLAFTFDHGFETEEAVSNVRNAVEILGVDHLYFRSDHMKEMFTEIVRSGSNAVLCHVCSIWYMQVTFDIARRYDIPVIIAGWTRGQAASRDASAGYSYNSRQPEFAAMAAATRAFLDEYARRNPRYRDFPRSMDEAVARASKRHRCLVLSPHWFLPVDSDSYTALLEKELQWKMPSQSYPARSTNCMLNFLSVQNSMKHFGYTHYHVEMSKMIREGVLSREEALDLLKVGFEEKVLDSVRQRLGCGLSAT